MSRKRDNNRETVYNEIHIYKKGSCVPKTFDEGLVVADPKALYVGHNGNWRIRWKDVEDVNFDWRNSLTIKSAVEDIECLGNSSDNFGLFFDYVQKIWNKKQGKTEARASMESVSTHRPAKKQKRRTYGGAGKSYGKPRLTIAQPTYFSSDDEKDDTFQKESWRLPEGPDEVPPQSADEGEDNGASMDIESPDGHDESKTLDLDNKRRRIKGKGRLQRRTIDNDEDSDDDMFNDSAVTTPASKRLVSPANANDSDGETESKAHNAKVVPSPSTKGNRTITHFFRAHKDKTLTQPKTITHQPKTETETTDASSFSKTPPATPKQSLKQDHNQWLENSLSLTRTPRRKKVPTPKVPKMDDSVVNSGGNTRPLPRDISSEFFGTKKSQAEEIDDPIENSPIIIGLHHRTSGVSRGRFGPRVYRKSPVQVSPKRNLADKALAIQTLSARTPKTVCRNPYAYDRENKRPNEVSCPKSPWRGLRNLGNTCYLNSSLQMLFSVPTFVSSLVGKGKDLAKSIVSVSEDVKDSSATRAANPNTVKEAVDAVTDKFEGYEQRDAHEFLSDLIDRVHDEMEEERKERGIETTDETSPFPTDAFFRLNVQVCLTCDSCGYAR